MLFYIYEILYILLWSTFLIFLYNFSCTTERAALEKYIYLSDTTSLGLTLYAYSTTNLLPGCAHCWSILVTGVFPMLLCGRLTLLLCYQGRGVLLSWLHPWHGVGELTVWSREDDDWWSYQLQRLTFMCGDRTIFFDINYHIYWHSSVDIKLCFWSCGFSYWQWFMRIRLDFIIPHTDLHLGRQTVLLQPPLLYHDINWWWQNNFFFGSYKRFRFLPSL